MSRDAVLRFIEISSTTKDSLLVTWTVRKDPVMIVSGYRIGYQALGSSVVQFTQKLRPLVTRYDITNLHENTVYNVCVEVISNASSVPAEDIEKAKDFRDLWGALCVTGTTNSDSLSVALGSTVGAFVALAVIVFFVLFAKWHHSRRKRKLQFLERRFITSGEYSFDEELQRRISYNDDDEQERELTATGSGLLYSEEDLRRASGSGSPAILVYVDDSAESQLEGAGDGSSSRLIRDCFDSSSFFVTDLGEGQGYGLLLPLSRASEFLPLIVEDTDRQDGVQPPTTSERSRSRSSRVGLQKHMTVDYGIHWDPEYGLQSGTLLFSHPEVPVEQMSGEPRRTEGFLRSDEEWGRGLLLRRPSGAESLSREGHQTPKAVLVTMTQWQQDNYYCRANWTRSRSLSV